MLTFEQIKELIEQVANRGLQCLEVERSGFRLKIEGQPAVSQTSGAVSVSAQAAQRSVSSAAAISSAAQPAPLASPAGAESAPEQPDEGPPPGSHVLNSPIVGTFYRRPSPDADPFVQVGSRVEVGKVLCIVEAMKLMNEIESDVDGEIVEIYPENGQPVEYGEPLFAIKAD